MGCSNEKAASPKFTLNDLRRKIILDNAHQVVLANAQLRAAVISVCQRFDGEKTSANILADDKPVAHYFNTTEQLPKDLGLGDKSIANMLYGVKLAAADSVAEKLGPAIELERPKIRNDVELQKIVRHTIHEESDMAVEQCTREQVDKVLTMLANRAAAAPPAPVVAVRQQSPQSVSTSPSAPAAALAPPAHLHHHQAAAPAASTQHEAPSRSPSADPPFQQVQEHYEAPHQRAASSSAVASSAYVQQPQQKPQAVGGASNNLAARSVSRPQEDVLIAPKDAVNLPKGDWVKAEGTPYYYSASEKLYFHPPSHQFYDPANDMWYDPDKDEWYADEDQ